MVFLFESRGNGLDNQPKVTITENGKTREIVLPPFGKLEVLTNKGKITFIHTTESQVMDQ
jgi:hypothetical protein